MCDNCHGPDAEGGFGPDLAGGRGLTLDQFRRAIRRPWEVMPTFNEDQLSDRGVANVYAFVGTKPRVPEPGEARPGDGARRAAAVHEHRRLRAVSRAGETPSVASSTRRLRRATGTDVRGDRPGRSFRSPSERHRFRAAASCGHSSRAMAAAPSAPSRCGKRGQQVRRWLEPPWQTRRPPPADAPAPPRAENTWSPAPAGRRPRDQSCFRLTDRRARQLTTRYRQPDPRPANTGSARRPAAPRTKPATASSRPLSTSTGRGHDDGGPPALTDHRCRVSDTRRSPASRLIRDVDAAWKRVGGS